jgi:hypothetical protein
MTDNPKGHLRRVLDRLNALALPWDAVVYVHDPSDAKPPLRYAARIEAVAGGLKVCVSHDRRDGGGWWARIDVDQRPDGSDHTDRIFWGLYGSHDEGYLGDAEYTVLAAFIHDATYALAAERCESIRKSRASFFES